MRMIGDKRDNASCAEGQAKAASKQYNTEDSSDSVEVGLRGSIIGGLDGIAPETKLANRERRIWVVTTAALPWRTGTAVNALMRALYLTRGRPKHYVTLFVPWLEDAKARRKMFGAENSFTEGGMQAQEEWIRNYCRTRANCVEEEKNLRIWFWNGRYIDVFKSIFPTEDICSKIPDEEADIAILEEPEHLNWFRAPDDAVSTDHSAVPGWTQKFSHVVGVLHTNYGAYMRQYAWGASLVTAPALNALSSLCIRAYCKRVIRLSATLPSFDPTKEVTCNVHGVRSEFLDSPVPQGDAYNAPVYFVGKVIWAKGFDLLLELEEAYKRSTGEYFPLDVYGSGDDIKAIRRAFFGRHGSLKMSGLPPSNETREPPESDADRRASEVFENPGSLRALVCDESSGNSDESNNDEDTGDVELSNDEHPAGASDGAPLLGDLTGKTLGAVAETADAALKLIDSVMSALTNGNKKLGRPKPRAFHFVPPVARFKWRFNALPARFLGVKDHIVVRDIPEQKIFLNMSTTEVLCTTSAEALAMGKFVVLPKHPSNEFFYQFPNCLAYDDIDDCVEKLRFTLQNKPQPLTENYAHLISWEGATERLFDASAMTTEEIKQRKESGKEDEDSKAARFHIESSRKSRFVSDLFSGKALKNIPS